MENKEIIIPIKKELPALADLYEVSNIETLFKKDQFNLLMNQDPKPEWIKKNPYAGNSNYIAIGVIETLLQRIFKEFRIEILREGTMFNSVYSVVRVHFTHPVTGEWTYHDGAAACQVQTKTGSSPANLGDINNNAVMMALPMSVSYAIKDACEHLGRLFGRDINRKDVMAFGVDKSLDKEAENNELQTLFESKKDFIPAEDFDQVKSVIDKKQTKAYARVKSFLENIKTE